MDGKSNPRFVVTNLRAKEWPPKELYEDLYCARGDMENRIKEQQLYLFVDRTSSAWISSNQLRLWFSTITYIFFVILRETGLKTTEWTRKQASSLRLSLLKVSAVVKTTCRAIRVTLPRAFPYWELWKQLSQTLSFFGTPNNRTLTGGLSKREIERRPTRPFAFLGRRFGAFDAHLQPVNSASRRLSSFQAASRCREAKTKSRCEKFGLASANSPKWTS